MTENSEHAVSTIYEQLGGNGGVKTAVTVFYNRVTNDDALAQWFEGVDLSRLRAHQRAFLAAALDGPQVFAGRDLSDAHAGMQITDEAFTLVCQHLAVTLGDLGVAPDIVEAVGVRLENLRSEVVAV